MGRMFINLKKEYQVQYKRTGLNRININYFDSLKEAEDDFKTKVDSPEFQYTELIECIPIKAYQK